MRGAVLSALLSLPLAMGAWGEITDAVGIWLFDEGQGDTVKDMSGNGNDGKLVGGGEWVDGKFGKAIKFNGANQCVEVPDSDSLDIEDEVTILCWFWWEGAGDAWQTFVSKGPMSGTWENWAYFINSGGRFTHFVINPNGQRIWTNSPNNSFEPQKWHFTAGVYDGKSVKLYIDGKLVTNRPLSGKLVPNDFPLRIGHREGSTHWWNGVLDEVAVFRRALSEAEINEIMKKGLAKVALSVRPKGRLAALWGEVKAR